MIENSDRKDMKGYEKMIKDEAKRFSQLEGL